MRQWATESQAESMWLKERQRDREDVGERETERQSLVSERHIETVWMRAKERERENVGERELETE